MGSYKKGFLEYSLPEIPGDSLNKSNPLDFLLSDTVHNILTRGREEVEGKSIKEIIFYVRQKLGTGIKEYADIDDGLINSLDEDYLKDNYHLGTQISVGYLVYGYKFTYDGLMKYLMDNVDGKDEVSKNEFEIRCKKIIENMRKAGLLVKKGKKINFIFEK